MAWAIMFGAIIGELKRSIVETVHTHFAMHVNLQIARFSDKQTEYNRVSGVASGHDCTLGSRIGRT